MENHKTNLDKGILLEKSDARKDVKHELLGLAIPECTAYYSVHIELVRPQRH